MASEMAFVMRTPPPPSERSDKASTPPSETLQQAPGKREPTDDSKTVDASETTDGEPLHRCDCHFCVEATTVSMSAPGQTLEHCHPEATTRRKSSFERLIQKIYKQHDDPDSTEHARPSPMARRESSIERLMQGAHMPHHHKHDPHDPNAVSYLRSQSVADELREHNHRGLHLPHWLHKHGHEQDIERSGEHESGERQPTPSDLYTKEQMAARSGPHSMNA